MKSIFPAGRGVAPFVARALTADVKGARPVPYAALRLRHFRQSPRAVRFWPPSVTDINRIVQIAEAVKSPKQGLPIVMDIGTGTGLLPFLLAQTGRVATMGVDPFELAMKSPVHAHANLRFEHAGIEWAVENFRPGEIDLAIWSWPMHELNPLEHLKALAPRAALLIFNIDKYRIRFDITDTTIFKYHLNFDQFDGFRKVLLWKGIDWIEINSLDHKKYFRRNNLFVLYMREDIEGEIPIPEDDPTAEEYHWITGLHSHYDRFPGSGEVERIDESFVLCPAEERF